MVARYSIVIVLCACLVMYPIITGADDAAPPSPAPALNYDQLVERYDAQRSALSGAVAAALGQKQLIQRLVNLATKHREETAREKARTLAETKSIAAILQQRHQAEEALMAAVLKELEATSPQFREHALRAAKDLALRATGQQVADLLDLPALKNGPPLTYAQHAAPELDLLFTKITSPAETAPEPPANAAEREMSKQLALRKIVDYANAIRAQQPSVPNTPVQTKEQRLSGLVNEYLADKITSREYYQRRQEILSER